MPIWLESILAELKGVQATQVSLAEPEEEPGSRDHVVGVVDEDLRKLLFLVKQYRKRMLEIIATLIVCSAKEREAQKREAQRFDAQTDTLKDMFYGSVRVAFPELCGKPSIGIRKGWKVVWSDPEDPSIEILGVALGAEVLEEMLCRSGGQGNEAADSKKSRLH